MRKHFLLLFLMALLPLAGWAVTDISGARFTINVVSFRYTAATPTIGPAPTTLGETAPAMIPTVIPAGATDALVYDTDYSLKFYDKDGNPIATSDVKAVGNYQVAAEGKGDYIGITKKVDFQILPAKLTVTITADITKEYANYTKPTVEFTLNTAATGQTPNGNVTVTGWVGTDGTAGTALNTKLNTIVSSLDFAWTEKEKEAKANYDGSNFYNASAKGQQLTWSATSVGDNYEYDFVHSDGMKVTPVALTVGNNSKFTYTVTGYTRVAPNGKSGGFEYTGASQVPTYTITYKDPQGTVRTLTEKTATAANDFAITYVYQAAAPTDATIPSDAATDNMGAGYYWPIVKPTAKGNYKTDQPQPFKFDGNTLYYQIRKKALSFGAVDVTKVYDGQAFTETSNAVDGVTIEANGLVAADMTADNLNAIATAYKAKRITGSEEFDANVGMWEVEPTGTFGANGFWLNYYEDTENQQNGFMTIVPRPVTVTPNDITDNIARGLTNFETLVLNTTANDAKNYAKFVTIQPKGTNVGVAVQTPGSTDDATAFNTQISDILKGFTLGLTASHEHKGSWEGIVAVTPKATTGDDAYTGNYQIIAGENADYEIEGRTWTISPKAITLTYGQKVPDNLKYNTTGLGTTFDDSGIKYIIKKVKEQDNTETVVTIPENGRIDVLGAGYHYVVYIDPASKVTAPVDYENPTFSLNPALLTISAKQLYAIPADVALNTGDTQDDLNTLGKDAVRFLDSNATNSETGAYTGANALEEGDVISFKLVFGDGVTFGQGANASKITNTQDVAAGVKVVAVTTTTDPYYVANQNANYQIDFNTTAKLVVGAYVLTLKDGDAQILDKIQIAAAKTTQKYSVKFVTDRKLAKQKWNAFVLPFDVDLNAVSNTLGYAIFNVYNEAASTANTVKFKLTMDKIPANTPFLVKTASEVTLKNITFEKVLIKNPESVNPSKEYKGKATAVGCYADTEITGNDYYFYNDSWQHGASTGEPTVLPMTMAYWTPAEPQNARVFVEDLDSNGTTVIREINTQSMTTVITDGWYTLNGVKLQGAPTEKGIYINNGKKIVIK